MTDDEVKKELDELFKSIDVTQGLRRLAFGGFDSFEEYFKYGEMFHPHVPWDQIPPEDRKYCIRPRHEEQEGSP